MPLEILIEHNTKSNFDGLFWFEYVLMEMFNILIFLKIFYFPHQTLFISKTYMLSMKIYYF